MIKHASERDGFLNDLVRSLCGGSQFAVHWETRAAHLPAEEAKTRAGFRKHVTVPNLGPHVRPGVPLDYAFAELEAVYEFASSTTPVKVSLGTAAPV